MNLNAAECQLREKHYKRHKLFDKGIKSSSESSNKVALKSGSGGENSGKSKPKYTEMIISIGK